MKKQKSETYSNEFKNKIGRYLLKAPRGSLKRAAEMLEVSPRTLNEWKRSAEALKPQKKLGRPRRSASFFEKLKIAREWKRQGYPGALAVGRAMPSTPARTIRALIAQLKRRERSRREKRLRRSRTSITVLQPGLMMAIDATLIDQGEDVLVARDRASLVTHIHPCRKRAKTFDTLQFLKKLEINDRLPMVLASDNGGAFASEEVRAFCSEKKIVLLRSLPRTPQHNGACELAVREVKDILRRGVSLDRTCLVLNRGRKRRRLGFRTANEFDQQNFVPYTKEVRAELYAAVSSAIETAKLGTERALLRRKMEREAILRTLERFKLITITRGDQLARSKPEDIR